MKIEASRSYTEEEYYQAAGVARLKEKSYLDAVYDSAQYRIDPDLDCNPQIRNAAVLFENIRASHIKRELDGLASDFGLVIGGQGGNMLAGRNGPFDSDMMRHPLSDFFSNPISGEPVSIVNSQISREDSEGEVIVMDAVCVLQPEQTEEDSLPLRQYSIDEPRFLSVSTRRRQSSVR